VNQPSRPSFWERWADFTIQRSRPILVVVALLTIAFTASLFRLQVGSDLRAFHRTESVQLINTLESDFHEGNYLTLIFETQTGKSLLTPDLLSQQFEILQEIKKRYKVTTFSLVDGIDQALRKTKGKSLLDQNDYTTIAEGIIALSGGKTVKDLEKVSRNLLSHPDAIHFYQKFRIAGSLSPAMIGGNLEFSVPFVKAIRAYVQLDSGYTEKEQREIAVSIRELMDALKTKELKGYVMSDLLAGYDIDRHARTNAAVMVAILLVSGGFLLMLVLKSPRELSVVFLVLASSSLWTFGMASLLGIKISAIHLLVLPILLGTGDDNSVVFSMRLSEELSQGRNPKEAIRSTYVATGNGIFLTTFTTLVGFLACGLTISSKAIVSFNLLASLSMAILFLLSLLLEGAVRAEIMKHRGTLRTDTGEKKTPKRDSFFEGLAPFSAQWIAPHRRLILTVSALLVLAGFLSALRIETSFDLKLFLRRDMPTYKADVVRNEYFGQTDQPGYILFEGNVENPALLGKMRQLQDRMARDPVLEKIFGQPYVESVNDLIDKMGLSVDPQTPVKDTFNRISGSDETANYVLDKSYRQVSEHYLRKRGDRYDGLVMKLFTQGGDTKKIDILYRTLQDEIRDLRFDEIPGLKVSIGGGAVGNHLEGGYYFANSVQSLFLSLIPNLLLLLVVWRRLKDSVLAMIPIVFSITLVVGLMSLLGVKLNVLNLEIGAIVIGLGVDYPIHLIERFEEERRGGSIGRLEAAQAVLSTMGTSVFAGCLTTVVGFVSFCVLAMPIAESFGLLMAAAILLVYASSTVLLPALLTKGDRPQ
jgi:uncharacterized protein